MPIEDGVGYGKLTQLKIDHLTRILGMHLAITQAVLNRFPNFKQEYRYLDLTAGKGVSPNGIQGSPLIFLKQAASHRFWKPYRADFIEQNPANLTALKNNVDNLSVEQGLSFDNTHFHLGNYEKVIPTLLERVNRDEFGLAFVDPSGDAPHFQTLQYIVEHRPKIEILIYLPTTNLKRTHHLTHKLLSDYMQEIDKKYWLVRKPVSWDPLQWTFLLGSNTSIFTDYKKIDFMRLDSVEAQQFFPKLNLSKKQRMAKVQPRLL